MTTQTNPQPASGDGEREALFVTMNKIVEIANPKVITGSTGIPHCSFDSIAVAEYVSEQIQQAVVETNLVNTALNIQIAELEAELEPYRAFAQAIKQN